MVQGTFAATLEAQADAQTAVRYVIDVAIRGKLGQFGQSVIQDTARRISAEFLNCVKTQMEAPEGEAAPPPMSSGQAGNVAARAFLAALMKVITDFINRLLKRGQPEEQRRA